MFSPPFIPVLWCLQGDTESPRRISLLVVVYRSDNSWIFDMQMPNGMKPFWFYWVCSSSRRWRPPTDRGVGGLVGVLVLAWRTERHNISPNLSLSTDRMMRPVKHFFTNWRLLLDRSEYNILVHSFSIDSPLQLKEGRADQVNSNSTAFSIFLHARVAFHDLTCLVMK